MNCFYVCGERIANIRQAFNVRKRINFLDFKISERVYGILPAEKGFTKGVTVDIKILVWEYLEEMDWDHKTAVPSRKKLEELGLKDIADDLEAR